MLTIGFVDDDINFIESLTNYLECDKDIQCTLKAPNSKRLIKQFKYKPEFNLDILFLDLNLGDESGLDLIYQIRKKLPNTEIIIFSVNENPDVLIKSFCLGATGYLLKESTNEEIRAFIHIVQKGGAAISPKMAKKLVSYFAPQKSTESSTFTDREHQILKLMAEGWEYKRVADKVNLSIDGVRFYIKSIYKKLNIHSKAELIKLYSNGNIPFD